MAFDQITRNRLQNFVSGARALLSEEFTRQLQNEFGIDPTGGEISSLEKLNYLDDSKMETARLLRDNINHYVASNPSTGVKEAINRIIREQAFTVLNRLCAIRMAEARGIIIESLSKGYNSKGFQLYSRLAGNSLGEIGKVYKCYIFSVFDEFAEDLPVLFDRYSPMGRLFPKHEKIISGNINNPGLVEMMNSIDIEALWSEDETIGWIYQYFNSKEERRKMRDESQAPRNSRELAVRNQFFTPRYVVEFLTDNTLGRIWYEMTQGQTTLVTFCKYLIRKPNERFLKKGEQISYSENKQDSDEEELLNKKEYILFRKLKDPREILMLDPACGSMHFGLYAFDIFEKIYEEAWELEVVLGEGNIARRKGLEPLQKTYITKENYIKNIPKLIIENNIHGVDIDPRAVQIAALSLWLRAQRSWKDKNIRNIDRPKIKKSNIVCAESMPGEKDLLKEFAERLKPRVLGQLVEIIFEKMELAGEAGTLLKIEEEIQDAIIHAREEYNIDLLRRKMGNEQISLLPIEQSPEQQSIFDFADLPDKTKFWDTAEQQIIDALKNYSEGAEMDSSSQRRLFSEDTARGFAFIDLCSKKFDVSLMNPPFGEGSTNTFDYLDSKYPTWNKNILCAFFERMNQKANFIGVVFDRSACIKKTYKDFRLNVLLKEERLQTVLELGWGVLDANVEVSAAILSNEKIASKGVFFDITKVLLEDKEEILVKSCKCVTSGKASSDRFVYIANPNNFIQLPNSVIGFQFPKFVLRMFEMVTVLEESGCRAFKGNDFKADQHFMLFWEIPDESVGEMGNSRWTWVFNGGEWNPYYYQIRAVAPYGPNAELIINHPSVLLRNLDYQGKPGVGFGKRGQFLDAQVVGKGFAYTAEGIGGVVENEESALYYVAMMNSKLFQYVINLYCGQHKSSSYVNLFPNTYIDNSLKNKIATYAKIIWENKYIWQSGDETDIVFIKPRLLDIEGDSLAERLTNLLQKEKKYDNEILLITGQLNELFYKLYNLTYADVNIVKEYCNTMQIDKVWLNGPEKEIDKIQEHLFDLISVAFGCLFGRWDIKKLQQERSSITHSPFDIPPKIQFAKTFNIESKNLQKVIISTSKIRINYEAFFIDKNDEVDILNTELRKVLESLVKIKSCDFDKEIYEIFGVDSIRDYINKSSNFFEHHLKQYTKSRRQAPIYWPITSEKGNYILWLYYPNVNNQTLYKCVNDFIEPKVDQMRKRIIENNYISNSTNEEIESLYELEIELKEFRNELLKVAKIWKVNLNDGVQINAAPLWRFFKLPKWQNTLKEVWESLKKGDSDWSYMAFNIWPERVIRKAHKSRYIALAHNLGDELWEEVTLSKSKTGKIKTKWMPKKLSEQELREIIIEKTKNN